MLVVFTLFLWAVGIVASYIGWGFIEHSVDAVGLTAVGLFSCGVLSIALNIVFVMTSAQTLHALLKEIREKFKD